MTINTKKLLEIEKEIVREVVRGDKHNLRKSANRNAQISAIHSAHCSDLCFAICRFSQVVFVRDLEQRHTQYPFLFPIVFGINLIPFFDIGSVLAVLSPLCSGMRSFTWHGPLRGHNCCCLWPWQLGFDVSLWAATSNLPSSPNPLSNRSVLHAGRKHKTTVFSQSNAVQGKAHRTICHSSLSAAADGLADGSSEPQTSPFKGDAQLTTELKWHWKIAQSCRSPAVSARFR